MKETMFIDPQRCIGCRSCVAACRECSTHKGYSMIFVDYIDRAETTATMPTVCMHCEDPICARVCPADAIKQTPDGVYLKSFKQDGQRVTLTGRTRLRNTMREGSAT